MELIRHHLPNFVKHVLAAKNEFCMAKMTWRIYKSFGIRAGNIQLAVGTIPKEDCIMHAHELGSDLQIVL